MTRVDFVCAWILLGYLIEMLERPGYIRLPPARYYHGHKNEIGPKLRVGTHVPKDSATSMAPRITVSRRKWMLDQPIERAMVQPVPLRMPALPYHYSGHSVTMRRTLLGLKLLAEIEKVGDICGVGKSSYWKGAPKSTGCDSWCVCTVIVNDENQYHRHRCEHGEWRHKTHN